MQMVMSTVTLAKQCVSLILMTLAQGIYSICNLMNEMFHLFLIEVPTTMAVTSGHLMERSVTSAHWATKEAWLPRFLLRMLTSYWVAL